MASTTSHTKSSSSRTTFHLSLQMCLFAVLAFCTIAFGSTNIPFSEIVGALTGGECSDTSHFIIIESRIPQLVTAALGGTALGLSGLVMQTIFSNPLADPSILGVNSGASLGAAIAILLLGGSFMAGEMLLSGFMLTALFALAGAVIVIVLLVVCSTFLHNNLMLLIAGVMISYLTSSVVSLLSFYSTDYGVQSYVFWGLGDFSAVTSDRLIPYSISILAGVCSIILLVKPLNALLLGEDYAKSLGIRLRSARTTLLLSVGWLSAIVTAFCGPISFIGLAVPHAARFLFSTSNHRTLIPATLLLGCNTALLCNVVSHLPGSNIALPVNSLTSLLGVPVVLYLLIRRKNI
ncbi:FecCD family ABC transporter permease [Pseudoprevotella muciniphila]|nr:iron ABC transporter permease [Pseudoprevotella muciniphila]